MNKAVQAIPVIKLCPRAVGCEHNISTAVGQTPAGQLEAGIAAQIIQVVGILDSRRR